VAAVATGVAVLAGLMGWWVGQRTTAPGPVAQRFDQFTQLTDEAGDESMPRVSPDGASFAYGQQDASGFYDIYVQRVGGRQPIPVAADPQRDERWPAFSPDGKFIAFSLANGGIFITGATGESERRLTDTGFNPAWSPDGKQIVFATEGVVNPYLRNSTSSVYVVDVAGGAPRLVTKDDAVQPVWSPNGKRIAAWQAILGQRDLITMAADGSDRVVLLNDPPMDYSPAWSPDGRYLYFASDRSGTLGLWRIPMDESSGRAAGVPEAVSLNVEATMDQPSISADGKTLVFRSRLQSVNPTALPFDPVTERAGTPRPLISRTGILNPTSVSPDGQWLALANQGEIREDGYVMRTDGTGLRRVTDDVARDRQVRWTPDGKALLFYSNRDGQYAPYMIRPDGSGLMRLTPVSQTAFYYPTMSPKDGMLTVSTDDYRTFIVTPPLPAKESQMQLIKNVEVAGGIFQGSNWSPDAKYLSGGIASKDSGASVGVGVYDFAAGKAIKLTDDGDQFSVPFLPDSKRLIFISPRNELVVVDIATGRRRVIPVSFGVGTTVNTESIAVAPDGKTIYYGAQRVEANVWKVTAR
jgi:Tol biopolymer transport system component